MSGSSYVPAIETRALRKRFAGRWAVGGIDLLVEPKAIYGFLGRNGSGKTTAIRLILGLLRPTDGGVKVFGYDVASRRLEAARQVGALLEARATYDHLTGHENLDLTRRLLGLPASEIGRVLEAVEMSHDARRKVGHYSLGMRQRIGLARAMLGEPRLLILDEPMNGLDPDGMREMRNTIRSLPDRTGATVFLSSHLLSEVQQTATHIGLMHEGRLIVQGAVSDLLQLATPDLLIRTNDSDKAMQILAASDYRAIRTGESVHVRMGGDRSEIGTVARLLVNAGLELRELTPQAATVESLYVHVQQSKMAAA